MAKRQNKVAAPATAGVATSEAAASVAVVEVQPTSAASTESAADAVAAPVDRPLDAVAVVNDGNGASANSADTDQNGEGDGDDDGHDAEPAWPLKLRVRNNGGFVLTVHGKLLQPGGTDTFELHDMAHAEEFGESLKKAVADNYIPLETLSVEQI